MRIDVSNLRLHKETDKSFVFTDSSPRTYKGSFTTGFISLPKSYTNVIIRKDTKGGQMYEMVLDIPQWLYDNNIRGNKQVESKIKVL